MKWFKHDSDAGSDAKLLRVRMKYGMEGYGLYWHCLELIVGGIDESNLTFELEHDAEIIAHQTGIHYERVQEMMAYMVEQGLFENRNGNITCMKLLKRLDKSMTSNKSFRAMLDTAKENHDSVMTKSESVMQDLTTQDLTTQDKEGNKDAPDVDGLNLVAWKLWVDYRRKAKLRKYTTDAKAKELARLPHDEQLQCVEYSIGNEYSGLFPDRSTSKKKLTYAEELAQGMQKRGML